MCVCVCVCVCVHIYMRHTPIHTTLGFLPRRKTSPRSSSLGGRRPDNFKRHRRITDLKRPPQISSPARCQEAQCSSSSSCSAHLKCHRPASKLSRSAMFLPALSPGSEHSSFMPSRSSRMTLRSQFSEFPLPNWSINSSCLWGSRFEVWSLVRA